MATGTGNHVMPDQRYKQKIIMKLLQLQTT